jgi:hypothetical protein
MKKYIAAILTIATLSLTAQAQTLTATNANPLVNFFGQAYSWSTSINYDPTYSWTNSTLSVETGLAQITGKSSADRLTVEKTFGNWNAQFVGEFEGVGSAFGKIMLGGGYNLIQKGDFKIEANILAGADFNNYVGNVQHSSWIVEGDLKAVKVMTPNTFSYVGWGLPFEEHGSFNSGGIVLVGVGARF